MRIGRLGLGELFAIAGGGAVIAAVFHPWYSFRLSAAASDAITSATGLDPLSAALFEQGLNAGFASRQPTAWELFDRTDLVLLGVGALAVASAVFAVLGLVHRPQPLVLLLGGAAIVAVAYRLAIPPVSDPAVEVAIVLWGWVALGGSIVIALSATISPPSGKARIAAVSPAATPEPAVAAQPIPSGMAVGGRAAGWYDDPDGSGCLRYWDGGRWTWDTKKRGAPA